MSVHKGANSEGTFRQAGLRRNEYFYDLAQYAVLKSDWESQI